MTNAQIERLALSSVEVSRDSVTTVTNFIWDNLLPGVPLFFDFLSTKVLTTNLAKGIL